MHNMKENIFPVGGAVGCSILAQITIIDVKSVLLFVLITITGAVIGYVTKKVLDYFYKKYFKK